MERNTASSRVDSNDETAIRVELAKYVAAALDQDWEAFCDVFDPEPVCMPPGAPAMASRSEIERFYSAFPPLDSLELESTEFEKAGDVVIERGTYDFTSGDLRDRGKYLHIWRRRDGSWGLYRNISNSDGGST